MASTTTLEGSVTGTDPVSGGEPVLGAGTEGVPPVIGDELDGGELVSGSDTDGSELVSGIDTDGNEEDDSALAGTRGSDPSPVSAAAEVLGTTKVCGAAPGARPVKAR